MEWLTETKIPLGKWISSLMDALNEHADFVFYTISDVLEFIIENTVDFLVWLPAFLIIAFFGVLAATLHKSWKLTAFTVLSLLLVVNLGYWEETMETLALVIYATLFCMLIGVPLGVASAHRPWLHQAMRPVLDLMQTIPTFVYLIPTLILFGLGVVPGLISTVIFAIAAPIRLTHLGISNTPKALLEAGESFGCTPRQLLFKVELPSAMPSIMAGLTQCIMLSLSMVVIAALVGADGLGKPVVRALNTVNVAQGFEAGLAIVILAIVLDRICRRDNNDNSGQ
ncbi:choline ABC transporter permease subunit [Thalassospira sp.]|uniref:choline ABC transporter permease subunit n=1 Tax=Thalassospira sp. TaxID=1912094 RepID=UPI003AA90040